jgi:hypothetical protein
MCPCPLGGVVPPKATDGPLIKGYPDEHYVAQHALGKTFVVDLERGGVTHYPSRPSGGPETRLVLDRGGAEQSYKLVTQWGPPAGVGLYATTEFLVIATYAAGEEKPFLITLDTDVFAGRCH